jgi:hypothetical protein
MSWSTLESGQARSKPNADGYKPSMKLTLTLPTSLSESPATSESPPDSNEGNRFYQPAIFPLPELGLTTLRSFKTLLSKEVLMD